MQLLDVQMPDARHRRRLWPILLLGVCWPAFGRATGGELSLRALSGHEFAILRHPKIETNPPRWPSVYLPRFGVHATYYVSQRIALGLGVEASLPRKLLSRGVGYEGVQHTDLVSNYHDIFLPLLLEGHLHNGSDWSWKATLAGGLALSHWQDVTALQPGDASESAPFKNKDFWAANWFGRLALGPVWRPNDAFALSFGAEVGYKYNTDLHLGVFLSGNFIIGVGRTRVSKIP